MSQRQTNSGVQTFNHVCEECNEAVCEIILAFCFPSTETVPALLLCVPVDRGSDIYVVLRQTLDAENGRMSPPSGQSGGYYSSQSSITLLL